MNVRKIVPATALADTAALPLTQHRRHLVGGQSQRQRHVPSAAALARRRMVVLGVKLLLPLCSLGLLTTIALWPELDRQQNTERMAFRAVTSHPVDGATLTDARYRGVDERNRPYTITSVSATQVTPERVDLKSPKADMTLESGTWMYGESRYGIFIQRMKQLDLWQDVMLYRNDGMTMRTPTATLDLKAGAAAGADPVHVEGPIGTLDAIGFSSLDKGHSLQFGPGNAVLNAASHSPPTEVTPVPMETIPEHPPARVQFLTPSAAPGPEASR